MGIQGLLPLLKSIQKPTHLRNFAGQTLGIDAYGWLHRGTVACAIELAEGKPTRKHIEFALNRVRMLIHFGVKPYLVFDGDYLPSKSYTEKGRATKRRESKKLGLELLRMGRTSQAQLELQKSVDVTPTMARELIDELKILGVQYVVAPYEADSQLAYLEKRGTISGVLSEDSDLLVFGVKRLLTKLDQYGECIMVNREHFTACREISLVGWSDKEFRLMAMLSGCDYLPGISGMGLKTAYRLVRKHKTIERVIRTVQFDGKMKVPLGYLDDFINAERTFLYQWVFCPHDTCVKNLTKLPQDLTADAMPFLGKQVESELAMGVACGDLDPHTKERIILPHKFLHPARRTSVLQTPNEKNGKPISEYFKARRVPLAELDPNSFTPSPSQQRLLETQRTASWSATQALAPSSGAIGRFARAPSSAPHAFRRVASDPCSIHQRMSPKRQRLCSDADTASGQGSSSTSRFFGAQSVQASPSLRKNPNNGKREEFELWSDDAAAEAVAAATSTPEWTQTHSVSSPRKRKKLAVFNDSPHGDDATVDEDTSQITVSTTTSRDSQSSSSFLTRSTSASSVSSLSQGIFSQGVNKSFHALPAENVLATQRRVSIGDVTFSPKTDVQHESAQTGRDAIPSTPPLTGGSYVGQDGTPCSVRTTDTKSAATVSLVAREIIVSSKGSEDLLVPNSPETSADEDGRAEPKLHLSKFAFAG